MNQVVDQEIEEPSWRRPVDSTLITEDETASKPPSYMTPHDRSNEDSSSSIHDRVEGQLQYSDLLRELNEYYRRENRLRTGISRLIFNTQQQREDEEEGWCTKYSYACQSCVLIQFKGIFMLFWLLTFLIVGIVSVALSGLPTGIQALWIPLFVYIILVIFVHVQKRKETERIKALEERFEAERRQMIQQSLLEQTKFTLPNDHFFEIHMNVGGHTHPIVKLLPPPPTYLNTTTTTQ